MHYPLIQLWAIRGVGPKVPQNFSLSTGGLKVQKISVQSNAMLSIYLLDSSSISENASGPPSLAAYRIETELEIHRWEWKHRFQPISVSNA